MTIPDDLKKQLIMKHFPKSTEKLIEIQEELRVTTPHLWKPAGKSYTVGGCFVCFERGGTGEGSAGDKGWCGASTMLGNELISTAVVEGNAGASYKKGLLALREGPLLATAVGALPHPPDVLLVNATGRDHPRRAGLALHIGIVLDIPTVGVTHRTLLAHGSEPDNARRSTRELKINTEVVGMWLRTKTGARPLAVNAGWRTDIKTAVEIVIESVLRSRTPEPLRQARRAAREARSRSAQRGRF